MLHCTQAAASTIRSLREQQGVPESYGLRVFPAQAPTGEIGLSIGFAEGPQHGDHVNEDHGQRLFVAAEVAHELSDFALDAVTEPSADGQAVGLRLVPAVADT